MYIEIMYLMTELCIFLSMYPADMQLADIVYIATTMLLYIIRLQVLSLTPRIITWLPDIGGSTWYIKYHIKSTKY